MSEFDLGDTWATLEPTPPQQRRIERRVNNWLTARESSLGSEWLRLLRISPVAGLGLAALAACLVLFTTSLSWAVFAVL